MDGYKFSMDLDRSQRSGLWFNQVTGNRQATSKSHIEVVGDSRFSFTTCGPQDPDAAREHARSKVSSLEVALSAVGSHRVG